VVIGHYDRYDEVQNSTTYRNARETGCFVINVPAPRSSPR
jgi:flavin reductase (DIM6/NTAB) family NADH-FMN oxidoreductase RutF